MISEVAAEERSISVMKKPSLKQRESFTGVLFCLPSIIGMMTFFIIPFCIVIRISFSESMGNPSFVGLKNYITIIKSSAFRLAALNTLKFNLIAVPLIIFISFVIAMLLFRKLRGSEIFRTFFVFPLVLPAVSVTLFFSTVFPAEMMESSQSFVILLILYIWKNCGYNIILFLAALNSVPKMYYEAAELDGAGKFTQITRITFPLIVPHTFFITIISIVNSFKSFREAFILFGSHPDRSIYMIQHFMNNNFETLNYIRLSVGAILIFLVIFALVLVMLILRKRRGDYEL